MPVSCKLVEGKWRLVESDGSISSMDRRGHQDEEACKTHAKAVNANLDLGLQGEDSIFQGIPSLAPLSETEEPLLFEKELIYVGQFKKGELSFSIDRNALDHWVRTFETWRDLGVRVPVPLEHTRDPEKRRGTIEKLFVKPNHRGLDALFSLIKFRDSEAAKLAKTADISIYSPAEWEAAGQLWVRPIVHAALTDYPVVPNLGDFAIVASLVSSPKSREPDMDPLKELCKELKLSVSDDADPAKLVVETVTTLQSKVESLTNELKLSRAKESRQPSPVSPVHVQMLRDNRELKLSKLVEDGRISKAVKDRLDKVFCSDEALKLSLGYEDTQDNFDLIFSALAINEVVNLKSTSGPQAVVLSAEDITNVERNPLLKDAVARASS